MQGFFSIMYTVALCEDTQTVVISQSIMQAVVRGWWGAAVRRSCVDGEADRGGFCVSRGADFALGGLADLLQPREPSVWLL